MSWSRSYAHMLAFALDILGAEIFWNQTDITISSLCWLVMAADELVAGPGEENYKLRLVRLNLYGWQLSLLRHIGPQLDRIRPNHRELAREADIDRAARVSALLR
jgi:hypothetical protein